MSDRPVEEMSFEEALKELEQVVGQLEQGDVALEKAIDLYKRGADLRKHCEARLRAAEEKVEQIRLNENGAAAATAPLDAD